jgi:hypothetical protein
MKFSITSSFNPTNNCDVQLCISVNNKNDTKIKDDDDLRSHFVPFIPLFIKSEFRMQ